MIRFRPYAVAMGVAALFATLTQTTIAGFIATTGARTVDGVTVSASADITVGNGTISIDLTNNQAGITTSGQALSGISFTFGNTAVSSVALQSITGQLLMIGSGGNPTLILGDGSPGVGQTVFSGPGSGGTSLEAGRWKVTSSSPPSVLALGGSQPDHLLLGAPNSNGKYGANLQDQFNPYFQNTLRLALTASGVTANSTITSVTFSFGTGPNGSVTVGTTSPPPPPPPPPAVPVPPTAVLALSGLFFATGAQLRRTRRRNV